MARNTIKHGTQSTWGCQHHIAFVFTSKLCQRIIFVQLKADVGYILRKSYEDEKVKIIEVDACRRNTVINYLGVNPVVSSSVPVQASTSALVRISSEE